MSLLAPGSFGWLLRHELRLAMRLGSGKPRSRFAALSERAPLVLLMLVPGGFGVAAAFALRGLPDAPGNAGIAIASAVFTTLLVLMVSRALILVLRTFHDRADLDLLLAAPLPPARVLAAKAVGVYALVTLPFLVLFGPFLLASGWLGHPRWLGALVMLVVAAVLATSISFALADQLTRLLGKRRTRIVIQVAVGLLAAVVFLASQSSSFAPGAARAVFRHAGQVLPAPLDWPARAVFAAPLPLAAMIALAAASAWAAARIAAHNFADPITEVAPPLAARAGPIRFRSGMMRVLIAKELRLLARDPELLSQVVLRMIYIIPVIGLLFGDGRDWHVLESRIAAACTLLAGLLASSLAWLTVCAEDAPELIDAAPVKPATVQRAKLIAACLPPMVIILIPVVLIVVRHPWPAAVTVVLSIAAAISAALLQAWYGKRQLRSAFRSRQRNSIALSIGESVMVAAWSGVAALLASGSIWAIAPLIVAGTILYASAQARPQHR